MFLQNLEKYTITLASESPRRHHLLEEAGIPFTIGKGRDIPEKVPDNMHVEDVALYLARLKSNSWRDIWQAPGQLVITADTIVALDNQVLGKPGGPEDARRMLEKLSGRSHRVISGVVARNAQTEMAFTDITTVHFKPLEPDHIRHYIDHYQPSPALNALKDATLMSWAFRCPALWMN